MATMEEIPILPGQKKLRVLQDYQLRYSSHIIGMLVLWNSRIAEINSLSDDFDPQAVVGMVSLINPDNNRYMGETCISDLVPCTSHPTLIPQGLLPKDDSLRREIIILESIQMIAQVLHRIEDKFDRLMDKLDRCLPNIDENNDTTI